VQDKDAMRQAAWDAVTAASAHSEVAARLKARFGWRCTDRQAVARLSQMLSPRDPHQLPADALLDIIAETKLDPFTPILLRVPIGGRRMVRVALQSESERRRRA